LAQELSPGSVIDGKSKRCYNQRALICSTREHIPRLSYQRFAVPDNNSNEEELIIKVSWLYYFGNLTQQEIARKMNLSRSKVGRLLQKALTDDIIEIKFNSSVQSYHSSLESEFEDRFNLREALITNSSDDPSELLDNLGHACARYLDRALGDDFILGIGLGTTIAAVLPHLVPRKSSNGTIVTLSGGFSQAGFDTSAYNISWPMANKLNARLEQMLCPLVAETVEVRNAIMGDSNIQAQLDRARSCDIALVSIGPVNHDMNLYNFGYIPIDDVRTLLDAGAVGEVLSSFYDQSGKLLETEVGKRNIGLGIPDLKRIPISVAVSGGLKKAEAILGALKNGFLDVLITDVNAAEAILKLNEKYPLTATISR
jgi:deoxyribonucleoside regulator